MTEARVNEQDLNTMILAGEAMEAFEKHYADDCVMQENTDEQRVGKDACRDYEIAFFGNVAEFHGAELLASAVDGERSYSEWIFDCTFRDGSRMRNTQVAARTWRDGKVIKEQFFYTPNVVASA